MVCGDGRYEAMGEKLSLIWCMWIVEVQEKVVYNLNRSGIMGVYVDFSLVDGWKGVMLWVGVVLIK